MEPRPGQLTGVGTGSFTIELPTQARAKATGAPIRRGGRAAATFVLGGLTTIEVLAVAIGTVAVMGFLWATHTVEPERLVTDPGLRAAWILLMVALVRPLTWIPYLLPFLAFRGLFDAIMPRRAVVLRNALANLATMMILGAIVWLVVATVEGAGTGILSALAFATGSGSFDTFGSFRGEWTLPRIAVVVAMVVLVRVALPPLGRDLDLSREPVLGFPDGPRGRFDRYLMLSAVAVAVVLGGMAVYLART